MNEICLLEDCNNLVEFVPLNSNDTLPDGETRLVAQMRGRAIQDFGIECAKMDLVCQNRLCGRKIDINR